MMTPCRRRCWSCGNVADHLDNITPHVCCALCGSQDTRLVKEKSSEYTDNQAIEAAEIASRNDSINIAIPPSEVEIAESIRANQQHVGSPDAADVIRRLAFQRDRWRDEIREVIRILNWHGHTTAIRRLENLLGDKS